MEYAVPQWKFLNQIVRSSSHGILAYRKPSYAAARGTLSKLPSVFRETLKQQDVLQASTAFRKPFNASPSQALAKRFSQAAFTARATPSFGKCRQSYLPPPKLSSKRFSPSYVFRIN